ncbi:hypothetical protein [Methanobrevibacter sp. YE315]|uniref:hypothetical protein n=1 Tax=Methanobrevibacter sp. YE315 TaxID=1609968 RepID=UPI000A5EB113|nr:hypothetical protein [Methanobrevibacter sp. YE315]
MFERVIKQQERSNDAFRFFTLGLDLRGLLLGLHKCFIGLENAETEKMEVFQ